MMDIMGYYVYSNYLKGCVFMNKIHFTKSSTKFSRTGKKATVLAATLAVMFACGGVSVQAEYRCTAPSSRQHRHGYDQS
jgi:hypothetical protein